MRWMGIGNDMAVDWSIARWPHSIDFHGEWQE